MQQGDILREPADLQQAAVSPAVEAAIHTRLPTSEVLASNSTSWRPRGLLVAHLAEHKKAVNRVVVASNAAFFASASDDKTVKIWDSRRLEKDAVFCSRLTYSAQACYP